METTIKVGDILAGTWGYSMVIPAFYKVVKVTPKRLKLMEYDGRMISHDGFGQQGYEVPDFTKERGEVLGRVKGDWIIVGSKYSTRLLQKWDGQPVWADYMD